MKHHYNFIGFVVKALAGVLLFAFVANASINEYTPKVYTMRNGRVVKTIIETIIALCISDELSIWKKSQSRLKLTSRRIIDLHFM